MPVHAQSLSYVILFSTPWTLALQASLSIEFFSGLPFLLPGYLPDPRIELTSPALAGRFFTTEPPGKSKRTVDMFQRCF